MMLATTETDQSVSAAMKNASNTFLVLVCLCSLVGCQSGSQTPRSSQVNKNPIADNTQKQQTFPKFDQGALHDRILKERDLERQRVGIKRLTDPRLLASIALADTVHANNRSQAVWRLKDQRLIVKIAFETKSRVVRANALRQIGAQRWLRHVALMLTDPKEIALIVRKLHKQDELMRVALDADSHHARIAAATKLRDGSLRARIARQDIDWRVRVAVLKTITDADVLRSAALGGEHRWERYLAASRYDKMDLLEALPEWEEGQRCCTVKRSRFLSGIPGAESKRSKRRLNRSFRVSSARKKAAERRKVRNAPRRFEKPTSNGMHFTSSSRITCALR
jgi:hypothetical protein